MQILRRNALSVAVRGIWRTICRWISESSRDLWVRNFSPGTCSNLGFWYWNLFRSRTLSSTLCWPTKITCHGDSWYLDGRIYMTPVRTASISQRHCWGINVIVCAVSKKYRFELSRSVSDVDFLTAGRVQCDPIISLMTAPLDSPKSTSKRLVHCLQITLQDAFWAWKYASQFILCACAELGHSQHFKISEWNLLFYAEHLI